MRNGPIIFPFLSSNKLVFLQTYRLKYCDKVSNETIFVNIGFFVTVISWKFDQPLMYYIDKTNRSATAPVGLIFQKLARPRGVLFQTEWWIGKHLITLSTAYLGHKFCVPIPVQVGLL